MCCHPLSEAFQQASAEIWCRCTCPTAHHTGLRAQGQGCRLQSTCPWDLTVASPSREHCYWHPGLYCSSTAQYRKHRYQNLPRQGTRQTTRTKRTLGQQRKLRQKRCQNRHRNHFPTTRRHCHRHQASLYQHHRAGSREGTHQECHTDLQMPIGSYGKQA